MSLFSELKRRNVIRVGIAYIVVAWLVAQVLQLVMESFAAPDWVMKTVLILLAAGIPFALLFAWVFELTPEGLKRETEIDRTQSITPQTGRKLDRVIIAVLVLALGYFAWDKFVHSQEHAGDAGPNVVASTEEGASGAAAKEAAAQQSIAVLPFVNMSSDQDQEYFSDGISEEILNALAKIPDLHVTSRSSAFAFKGQAIDIPTVARQLGVANVLEGSVRKSGNKVRITAQLIEAAGDRHLWSETYDRELDDIFAIQDEISLAIVAALKGHLALEDHSAALVENRQTSDTAAYEAYLRGHHLILQRTRPSLDAAVTEFQKAVQIDPEFALAHAELAIAHMLLIKDQYGEYTFEEATALAVPHADRAMELDPGLAESQAAAGFVLWHIGATPETVSYFEEALRINPNHSQVLAWMALVSGENGDYEEALEFEEKLLHIDPLYTPNLANLAGSYFARGRTESVNSILGNLAVISPTSMLDAKARISRGEGKLAQAVLFGLDALSLEPENTRPRLFLGWNFAEMQLASEAILIDEPPGALTSWLLGRNDQVITMMTDKARESKLTTDDEKNLGQAYAAIGKYKKALPLLEAAWTHSGGRVSQLGPFGAMDAAALIVARKAEDPTADTAELVEALASDVQRMKDAGVVSMAVDFGSALSAWFRGDAEAALYSLERSISIPFFMPENLHYLQDLQNHPGYARIRDLREQWLRGEQQAFLNVVCEANPYAAVWQPQPETCEGFQRGP
jgi:TolB-like protein/Tfp pilus assembly protein PilF